MSKEQSKTCIIILVILFLTMLIAPMTHIQTGIVSNSSWGFFYIDSSINPRMLGRVLFSSDLKANFSDEWRMVAQKMLISGCWKPDRRLMVKLEQSSTKTYFSHIGLSESYPILEMNASSERPYAEILIPYNSDLWLKIRMPGGPMIDGVANRYFYVKLEGPIEWNFSSNGWYIVGVRYLATVDDYPQFKLEKILVAARKEDLIVAVIKYVNKGEKVTLDQWPSHIHDGVDGLKVRVVPAGYQFSILWEQEHLNDAETLLRETKLYINNNYYGTLWEQSLWDVLPTGEVKLARGNSYIVIKPVDELSTTPQIQLVTNGYRFANQIIASATLDFQHNEVTLNTGEEAHYLYIITLGREPNSNDINAAIQILPIMLRIERGGIPSTSLSTSITETTTTQTTTSATITSTTTVTTTQTTTTTTTQTTTSSTTTETTTTATTRPTTTTQTTQTTTTSKTTTTTTTTTSPTTTTAQTTSTKAATSTLIGTVLTSTAIQSASTNQLATSKTVLAGSAPTTTTSNTITSGFLFNVIGSSWLLLVLATSMGGVVLILLAMHRRRGGSVSRELVGDNTSSGDSSSSVSMSRPVVSKASISETPSGVSFSIVESLLKERISGLIGSFGCVEGFSPRVVELKQGIAPGGFEGSWTCCLLGCGGWGCAYLCRREGGEVVFKVPRGFEQVFEGGFIPTVHARLVERIRSEAEIIRALKHPNILRLLGAARSAPILAYEFADGGSLDWQLARGWKPSMRDVLLVGIQVGDALRYIHSRGLVHGDIKPGNVFVKNGVVKVGDFSSIIRLVSMTSKLSKMSYTPGFRAPEQVYADLRRKVKELGLESRIDTYLLGNLLLYLLTEGSVDGEEAVGGGEVEKAVEEIEDSELRKIVKEALNPDPLQRPSTEEIVKKLLKIWVDKYGKY